MIWMSAWNGRFWAGLAGCASGQGLSSELPLLTLLSLVHAYIFAAVNLLDTFTLWAIAGLVTAATLGGAQVLEHQRTRSGPLRRASMPLTRRLGTSRAACSSHRSTIR